MLVNSKEMLNKASEHNYAVAQFNINNLEWAKFILEVCDKYKSPVILGASEGAIKYMGGYNVVYNIVNSLINDLNITIPVCLHLDHGSSVEACIRAVDAGFTSVMIDSSRFSLEDNIKMTKEVVAYANKKDVTVEAEVGHIGGSEDGITANLAYAEVSDCIKLAKETNIDSLAPALGSVHGLYKDEPKLDFVRMKEIKNKLEMPLVLHGGTGISDELIKKAISCGVNKININTELQIEWSKAVRQFLISDEVEYDPRKIIKSGESALKESVLNKILLVESIDKA